MIWLWLNIPWLGEMSNQDSWLLADQVIDPLPLFLKCSDFTVFAPTMSAPKSSVFVLLSSSISRCAGLVDVEGITTCSVALAV